MPTLLIRGVLCNWMVLTGVVAPMVSPSAPGMAIGMWMPVMLFFYMGFEHPIVNMFLFPSGLMPVGHFSVLDYLLWNETPAVDCNLVGPRLRGSDHYSTQLRTAARHNSRTRVPGSIAVAAE